MPSDARASISSVSAIVFDAVGTTMIPEPTVSAAYAAAGREFGSQLALEEIQSRFDLAFAKQESLDAESGQITDEPRERRRWWAIVRDVFGPAATEPLFDRLWEYFAEPGNWRLYGDVPAAWEQLENRNLVLCVASNFDSRLTSVCRGLPPLDRCDRVFISSLLGVRKPGLKFFATVQTSLGLPPEQILMVGDGMTNDFEPALAAGWQAMLVDRSRPEGTIQRLDGGWVVSSLELLPKLLGD